MSHMVPDWNLEDDTNSFHELLSTSNQKNSTGPYNELVELLWQDGHVVMHSQNHRKPPSTASQSRLVHRQEVPVKCGVPPENSSNPIQEDGTPGWFRYPIDDSLEKEIFSDFFCEIPSANGNDKLIEDVISEERFVKFGAAEESNFILGSTSKHSNRNFQDNIVLPPKVPAQTVNKNSGVCFEGTSMPSSLDNGGVINFLHFARPVKSDVGSLQASLGENLSRNGVPVEAGEPSSMRTIGSSMCGSNHVPNRTEASQTLSNDITCVLAKRVEEDARLPIERAPTDTYETAMTSSLGGSGSSFGKTRQQSTSKKGQKRKGRDGEESEYQSEDPEYESANANKPAQRSASARRSRAAEVHNLSERKRRDRINEKMKALQELIPHCNKSDKASMLDEAIEYLKSLQLQVQIMWMGSSMGPMMYSGMQQYMSRMGIGMGHSPVHSIHSPVQLPTNPLVNQPISTALGANQTPVCTSPTLNPASFPNQMQSAHLSEPYARYLGLHHIQPPPTQAMNLYMYGSHMLQQNQTAVAPSSSGLPSDAGVISENIKGRSDKRVATNH